MITMSIAVVKYLNLLGTRSLTPPLYTLVRRSSGEPCPPKVDCPPRPIKTECQPRPGKGECPPLPPPTCPEPPPCPTMPQCPPTICPPVVDPNNPCNYCPPPCIDPTYPDITRLKKQQCLFQQEDDLPIFLKKGNADAFLYQLTLVLVIISLGTCFATMVKLAQK